MTDARQGRGGRRSEASDRRPEETHTFQADDAGSEVGAGVGAEELDETLADEKPLAFPTSDAPGG